MYIYVEQGGSQGPGDLQCKDDGISSNCRNGRRIKSEATAATNGDRVRRSANRKRSGKKANSCKNEHFEDR